MIRSRISKMVRSMVKTLIDPIDGSGLLSRGLLSRYFVTLDPVLNSHYELATPITFAGDFEIEVEFSTTSTGGENTFCGHELYLKFRVANGKLQLLIGDGSQWYINATTGVGGFNDGKLHKTKLTKVGDVHKVFADGVEVMNITNALPSLPKVSFIGSAHPRAYFFNGIIANAKFTDQSGASDVVTTFKLDNSPAATNYTYSTEILDNNTFTDNANARQYLIATKGWIITDGGAA